MTYATGRLAFFDAKSPFLKGYLGAARDRVAVPDASTRPYPSTPTALAWVAGLGWGAWLGYHSDHFFDFEIVAFTLTALWLWWERKSGIFSHITAAFVIFAVWFHVVMALAYWPFRLLHYISN